MTPPLRVSGRPAVDILSRFYVTLPRMTGVQVGLVNQTMGIDVTRRAESIGDGPSSWGGQHIPQLENRLVSRCHAA